MRRHDRESPAPKALRRLGLFGGTFDPPHLGHLLVAVDAVEALALDQLIFVPAGRQPLKARARLSPAGDRLAMTHLLAGDDARFGVDALEIDRDGLSFTVDTLAAYAARAPEAERFFLLGADAWATFPRWREPDAILRLATMVVLTRGDEPVASAPRVLPTRRIDVSSTEIRARIRAGRSIRGFVPETVREYIERNKLYAKTTD